MMWDGITKLEDLNEQAAESRIRLSDAVKSNVKV